MLTQERINQSSTEIDQLSQEIIAISQRQLAEVLNIFENGDLQKQFADKHSEIAQNIRRYKKLIKDIETYKQVQQEINACLDHQRSARSKVKNICQLNPLDTNEKIKIMEERSGSRFNYLQFALSLPQDYVSIDNKANESIETELIKHIVIHPELISDNFLYQLGLIVNPLYKYLNLLQKTRLKIAMVDIIKFHLQSCQPLIYSTNTGVNKTSRICCLDDSKLPMNGNNLLIKRAKKGDNGPRLISIFPDVYSLLRSQKYIMVGKGEMTVDFREIMSLQISAIENIIRHQSKIFSELFGYIRYIGTDKILEDEEGIVELNKQLKLKIKTYIKRSRASKFNGNPFKQFQTYVDKFIYINENEPSHPRQIKQTRINILRLIMKTYQYNFLIFVQELRNCIKLTQRKITNIDIGQLLSDIKEQEEAFGDLKQIHNIHKDIYNNKPQNQIFIKYCDAWLHKIQTLLYDFDKETSKRLIKGLETIIQTMYSEIDINGFGM